MNARNILSRLFEPRWAGRTFVGLAFALFVFCSGGLVAGPNTIPQQRDWQPQRTWVFVVGTLEWKNREMFEYFPQKNRRDAQLVEFFRQQGVPQQQLVYLKDAQATTQRVKAAFSEFLGKAREGDLLFVYYCGHGYKSEDARTTYFATFDAGGDVPGWSTESIVKDVEKYFKGARAFLTADCCYSGSLAQQARQLGRRVSFACLTSSSASQLSTANWTFTETLLAGLSGRPFADLNGDGQITFGELAEDVKADLAFAEEQLSTFVTTGNFAPGAVLAQARRKSNPQISRRVEVRSEGKWWKARVIDARAGTFLVHYYGWEDWDDQWVRLNQIREPKVVEYSAGLTVEVIWNRKWYPAKILSVELGVHLIHYVGYDDGWDEWVGAKRIRQAGNPPRPSGTTWTTDKFGAPGVRCCRTSNRLVLSEEEIR